MKLKPLLDVYTGPYKDKYRFWTGLRLIIHLCLTVLFALTSGTYSYINNYIICVTVFFLTSITISQRNLRLRYREMLSYINLFLLALLSPVNPAIIAIVSVSVEMLVFTITVAVSIYMVCKRIWPGMCHTCGKCNLKLGVPFCSSGTQRQRHQLLPVDTEAVVRKREPMIFEN